MKRWALITVFLFALFGASIAAVSTTGYLRIERNGLEKASFCAINEKINCDLVNASSYSKIFGAPVSSFGFIFYILVAGMSLFAFLKDNTKATVAIAWFMSIWSLFASIYLAYVSTVILGVICIECLSMYVANIAIAIFLFVALSMPFGGIVQFIRDYFNSVAGKTSNLGFSPRVIHHLILIAAVFFTGWIAMLGIEAKAGGPKDNVSTDEKVSAFYMQSLYSITPEASWPVWGNPNAKITIVEYSEFQCPFCKMAAFNLKPHLQEFKDNIRFYFVNYPLDQACNKELDHPMHQYACFAAKAGVCANKHGDFWKFHDEIFRNQSKLNDEFVLSVADKLGWNKDEFKSCIDSSQTDELVQKDISTAKKIYVTGTPTVFVNNRKLRYWRDPDFLQTIVKEEIKRSK